MIQEYDEFEDDVQMLDYDPTERLHFYRLQLEEMATAQQSTGVAHTIQKHNESEDDVQMLDCDPTERLHFHRLQLEDMATAQQSTSVAHTIQKHNASEDDFQMPNRGPKKPLTFLDLPPKVRLLVYERLFCIPKRLSTFVLICESTSRGPAYTLCARKPRDFCIINRNGLKLKADKEEGEEEEDQSPEDGEEAESSKDSEEINDEHSEAEENDEGIEVEETDQSIEGEENDENMDVEEDVEYSEGEADDENMEAEEDAENSEGEADNESAIEDQQEEAEDLDEASSSDEASNSDVAEEFEGPAVPANKFLALFLVCKQIYHEAMPLFYHRVRFDLGGPICANRFLRGIGANRRKHIRRLIILYTWNIPRIAQLVHMLKELHHIEVLEIELDQEEEHFFILTQKKLKRDPASSLFNIYHQRLNSISRLTKVPCETLVLRGKLVEVWTRKHCYNRKSVGE